MGVDLSVPAAPLSVLETVLYAHDLVAIEDFYRRVLGLEPFSAVADRHIFYRCGNQMLLIFNPNITRNSPAACSLPGSTARRGRAGACLLSRLVRRNRELADEARGSRRADRGRLRMASWWTVDLFP